LEILNHINQRQYYTLHDPTSLLSSTLLVNFMSIIIYLVVSRSYDNDLLYSRS
ncbi:hypothetical protein L9F63_020730, partial [Diploptera punctata]